MPIDKVYVAQITNPTLRRIAQHVIKHGEVYNDGNLLLLTGGEWDIEVSRNFLGGHDLAMTPKDLTTFLIWSGSTRFLRYQDYEDRPSERQAISIAESVLAELDLRYGCDQPPSGAGVTQRNAD